MIFLLGYIVCTWILLSFPTGNGIPAPFLLMASVLVQKPLSCCGFVRSTKRSFLTGLFTSRSAVISRGLNILTETVEQQIPTKQAYSPILKAYYFDWPGVKFFVNSLKYSSSVLITEACKDIDCCTVPIKRI
jgi:hypothetical protein